MHQNDRSLADGQGKQLADDPADWSPHFDSFVRQDPDTGLRQSGWRTAPRPMVPALAIGETVILLHPPLPLLGVSTVMERGCQQKDSLVNGYPARTAAVSPTAASLLAPSPPPPPPPPPLLLPRALCHHS